MMEFIGCYVINSASLSIPGLLCGSKVGRHKLSVPREYLYNHFSLPNEEILDEPACVVPMISDPITPMMQDITSVVPRWNFSLEEGFIEACFRSYVE